MFRNSDDVMSLFISAINEIERNDFESHETISLHYAPSECHSDANNVYEQEHAKLADDIAAIYGSFEEFKNEVIARTSEKFWYRLNTGEFMYHAGHQVPFVFS